MQKENQGISSLRTPDTIDCTNGSIVIGFITPTFNIVRSPVVLDAFRSPHIVHGNICTASRE